MVRISIQKWYLYGEDTYMVKMPENGECADTMNVPICWKCVYGECAYTANELVR